MTNEEKTNIWDLIMAAYDKLTVHISATLYAEGIRKKQVAEIEAAGFFDPLPTPCIERRQGQGEYMRLIFPTDQEGNRRREYIGANPRKVKEAKEKITRSEERLRLLRELAGIQRDARDVLAALDSAKRAIEEW